MKVGVIPSIPDGEYLYIMISTIGTWSVYICETWSTGSY